MGPRELIEDLQRGYRGQDELRWNAHRAFFTVNDVLEGLETLEDRRKIILYISTGYDLNPLELQRLYRSNRDDRFLRERPSDLASQYSPEMQAEIEARNPIEYVERSQAVFADGQLLQEITELTDVANRTNTTFYTMDPRGLISSPDIDYDVPFQAWQEFMLAQRSSLRTLAELTGGFAIVNTNNFDEMLARIDAETSDYYVLGYYANNPDPTDRTRRLTITVTRPELAVQSRTSYTFRRPEPLADIQ